MGGGGLRPPRPFLERQLGGGGNFLECEEVLEAAVAAAIWAHSVQSSLVLSHWSSTYSPGL